MQPITQAAEDDDRTAILADRNQAHSPSETAVADAVPQRLALRAVSAAPKLQPVGEAARDVKPMTIPGDERPLNPPSADPVAEVVGTHRVPQTTLAFSKAPELQPITEAVHNDHPMTTPADEISANPPSEKPEGAGIHRIPQITLHAFCETPESIGMIEKAVADRRMARANCKVLPGGIAAAIDLYRKSASPNVVVIESRAPAIELYAHLDALADVCVSGTKVVVIGYANDIAIYRGLLLRGVSEYIVGPVDPLSVIAAVSRLYHQPGAKKFGRSLAFIGANGGVGSSTIAQNVAAMIARGYDADVLFADLDLPVGTASRGFDLNSIQSISP